MFYGDKEKQDAAIMNRAESYRAAAAVFPHLRKVLESFDGKVFNCRLEKALREDGNYWTVELKRNDNYGDMFVISFCRAGVYSSNNFKSVVYCNLGSRADNKTPWDGKRIPAAVLIESARKTRETFLKSAADLEAMTERAPELEKQLKYFSSQIENIVKGIPCEARDVYDLGYYVQKHW